MVWWISCRFLVGFVVLGGFWWNSGRPGGFLVDFLPVSDGFCGFG